MISEFLSCLAARIRVLCAFEPRRVFAEGLIVCFALTLIVALAASWFTTRGYVLYYGDAQAHLNISRSIVDSATPGYEQLGNVWLPLLHVLCLPFVGSSLLWSTGLAGTIPVAACFVIAGTCFYLAARSIYQDWRAATVVVGCFALNPNILYLASTPMTEVVFFAALALFLLCFARFRISNRLGWVVCGVFASWAMSLTRYDGWFLIPFCALWLAAATRLHRTLIFIIVVLLASLAPLYWMAHNWYETGNALDFFNGPYSAKAIQGGRPYPGFHDWPVALLYYCKAGQLCSGWPLCVLGILGAVCAIRTKTTMAVLFLCLTPAFYVWSIHSSQSPIFVPQFYPHGHYNTRYGLAVVVFLAFACGAIVLAIPNYWRRFGILLPAFAIVCWLFPLSPSSWICWKESEINSVARRAWTEQGAAFLKSHYSAGEGILTDFGDVTGVYCRAELPLRETISIGNGPAWLVATVRPNLFHPAAWAVAQHGGTLAELLNLDSPIGYQLTYEIRTPGAPNLEIYRRLP
jgi:Dolichyl-phosphate-mannose-protein mannosyltransferase